MARRADHVALDPFQHAGGQDELARVHLRALQERDGPAPVRARLDRDQLTTEDVVLEHERAQLERPGGSRHRSEAL